MSELIAVKAIDDWEIDVRAVPFVGMDSDEQYFDEDTDIMDEAFSTPLAIYQHGVKQGATGLQEKLIIVGKAKPGSLEKRKDGWWVRFVLDKTVEQAKSIMDAAWKGLVAVSSDSIAHLARLDIGGKLIPYEKNRAGRIAIWPLAGVSLWEMGNGNLQPASRQAIAMPAMKAIYRDAGLPFPDVLNSDNGLPEAVKAVRRMRVLNAQKQARQLLKKLGDIQ